MSNSRESLLQKGHIENLTEDHKVWSKEQSKDIVLTRYQARQVCLRIAKAVMAPREYDVYYMFIAEMKPLRQIAEELGISYNTVKEMKKKANRKIKETVKETGLAGLV